MKIIHRCKSGKILVCQLESDSSGLLNNLKFETRNGHLYFFDGDRQVFPDPVVYSAVRRFQRLAGNQNLEVAA